MTKRDRLLQQIKIAGYHSDSRAAVRLLAENPISRKAYNDAWLSGVSAREKGVPCSCFQCQREALSHA